MKDSVMSMVFGVLLLVPCFLSVIFEAGVVTAYFVGFFSCMLVFFIMKHLNK